jgi:hypothetical protein
MVNRSHGLTLFSSQSSAPWSNSHSEVEQPLVFAQANPAHKIMGIR